MDRMLDLQDEQTTLQIFSNNLNSLMQERDMSQADLARDLQMSPAIVYFWCKGEKMPRSSTIDRMCELFGVSRAQLMSTPAELHNVMTLAHVNKIPVLGTICAGDGVTIQPEQIGEVIIDKSINAQFALKVKGDSMRDVEIYDGDLVYIRKDTTFEQGTIYAIGDLTLNEAVIRQVYLENGKYLLVPANKEYKPKTVDLFEMFMIGKVVGVYRPLQGGE